jgi:DNA-directed RNA polymerase sigma subunit (sigma70/sigma32)
MSKIERRMVMKLGRDPTTEELSVAMDMTPEKINQIKKASLVPISLNQSVNEDDKGRWRRRSSTTTPRTPTTLLGRCC